ncbi:hypothetical protein XPA_000517 [Xanthoria parietina]
MFTIHGNMWINCPYYKTKPGTVECRHGMAVSQTLWQVGRSFAKIPCCSTDGSLQYWSERAGPNNNGTIVTALPRGIVSNGTFKGLSGYQTNGSLGLCGTSINCIRVPIPRDPGFHHREYIKEAWEVGFCTDVSTILVTD